MDAKRRDEIKAMQEARLRALTFGQTPEGVINMMSGMHRDARNKYIATFQHNIAAEFRIFARLGAPPDEHLLALLAGKALRSDPDRSLDELLVAMLDYVAQRCEPIAPWRDLLLIEWGLSKSRWLSRSALDPDEIIERMERAEDQDFDYKVDGPICLVRVATDLHRLYPDVTADFSGLTYEDGILAMFFDPATKRPNMASLD